MPSYENAATVLPDAAFFDFVQNRVMHLDNRIQVVIVDKQYLARVTYDGPVRMSERCALAAEQPSSDTFCNRTMSARHSRDVWRTMKEATCTKNVRQMRECSACGKTEAHETDKIAHKYM